MTSYVIDYQSLGFHRWMIADTVRTGTFQRAIEAAVRPGDAVLDVGAGTGILAMMAARAGARRVYAVEPSGVASLARRLVEENGLTGRVEVIQADAEEAVLPEKVDVIVAEVWGYIGVDENLLPKLLACRDRWLAPGGRMLPQTVTAWMAPVEDEWLSREIGYWRSQPYGLDLSLLGEPLSQTLRVGQHHLDRRSQLAPEQRMWTIDARTMPIAESRLPFEAQLRFEAARSGTMTGLAAWFSMELTDGITLGNGPCDPPTHWGRELLPLPRAVAVEAGTPIEAVLQCEPVEVGVCHQRWAARVGDH